MQSSDKSKDSKASIITTLFIIFLVSALISSAPFGFEFWKFLKNPDEPKNVYLTGVFSLNIFILLGLLSAFKIIVFKKPERWFRAIVVFLFGALLISGLFAEMLLINLIIDPNFIPEIKIRTAIFCSSTILLVAFFLEALGHSYD